MENPTRIICLAIAILAFLCPCPSTANDGSRPTSPDKMPLLKSGFLLPIEIAATTIMDTCEIGVGDIDLTVTGGTPPYTFAWSNGANTEDLINVLGNSTYTVTVMDANGDTQVNDYYVPNFFTIWANQFVFDFYDVEIIHNTVCTGPPNGAVIYTPLTNYPFNWVWTNGATGTTVLTGLSTGNYNATVTLGNCTDQTSVSNFVSNLPDAPIPTATIVHATCGQSNGSIDLSVTGANPLGGTSKKKLGLKLSPPPLDATAVSIKDTCGLGVGAIDLTVTGGVPPYTFNWSNGANSEDISGLFEGPYSVTVQDSNGESQTLDMFVINIVNIADISNINDYYTAVWSHNTACLGPPNGGIDFTPLTWYPFMWIWSNGVTTPDNLGISGGSYQATITLGNCWQDLITGINILNLPDAPLPTATIVHASCGQSNGSIDLSVSGANPLGGTGGNTKSLQKLLLPIDVTGVVFQDTCGVGVGSIDITVTGGTPPYTYTWSNGATTEDIFGLVGGNSYSVTVTDASGSTQINDFFLNNYDNVFNTNFIAYYSITVVHNSACVGPPNGALMNTPLTFLPFEWIWSNGPTTPDNFGLSSGNYLATITLGTCSMAWIQAFSIFNIPDTPIPTATIVPATCGQSNGSIDLSVTGANPLGGTGGSQKPLWKSGFVLPIEIAAVINMDTCGIGVGTINLTVTGGTQPYTFAWSNGATTEDLTGLIGNMWYTVTVTDANGESQMLDYYIGNYADIWNIYSLNDFYSFTGTNTNTACAGPPNGGWDLTPLTWYPFEWIWSNGVTTPDNLGLSAGIYIATITLGNCTQVSDYAVNIIDLPDAPIPTATIVHATCGQSNGSIDLSVTGANPLGGTGGNTKMMINMPPPPLSVTFTMQMDTCEIGVGDIDLTVTDGTPPYTFAWSNGANTEDLIGVLGNTTYTVTVVDAVGETYTNDIIVGNFAWIWGNHIIFDFYDVETFQNTSCTGPPNGAIIFTPLTNYPFTWIWNNGVTTPSNVGLSSGIYQATVTLGTCFQAVHPGGFVISNIPDAPLPTATIENATCALPNGALDVSVTASQPPYTYLWSNGATTEDISGLPPGTYTVTVTGANGCTATATYVIEDTQPFTVPGSITAVSSCLLGNGAIDLTPDPVGSYTFSWSNSATSEDISGLSPGTYAVTVTDTDGCTATNSFDVPNLAQPPTLSTAVTDATCGQQNGAINLTVTDGAPPYTFAWSNGATSEDIGNLQPGTYTVTVTGTDGCTATASATVGNTTVTPDIDATVQPDTLCGPTHNSGAISLMVSPPGNYTYAWSNGAATPTLTDLLNGNYTVTVTLGTGCTATATINVPGIYQSPGLGPDITPASCGESNGSVDVTLVGTQFPPYTFVWSNGATTEDVFDIPAGDYTVTATGANYCGIILYVTVPEENIPIPIFGTVEPNTLCFGSNGSINVSSPPPGPYSYTWSNGSTGTTLTGLPPGIYDVTVTTTNTCTGSASFTVPADPAPPVITLAATPANCGLGNGAVDANVSGGSAPYQYLWSNMAATPSIGNVPAGSYSLTVTDAIGCSAVASATVPSETLSVDILGDVLGNTHCSGSPNGSIMLSVSPTGSYTYLWSGGQTQPNLNGLASGSYTVTVTVAGNCTSAASFTVPDDTVPPTLFMDATPANCGLANGTASAFASDGLPPYMLSWSNGGTEPVITGLLPGNYSATVTDANGCTTANAVNVPNTNTAPQVTGSVVPNTSCNTPNGVIGLSFDPPGAYDVLWSGGQGTPSVGNLPAGSYSVTVSAGGNCTASATFAVPDNIVPDTTLANGTSCVPANVGTFVQTLENANGCDSVVVTTIAFAASDTTLATQWDCDPAMTGIFTQHLTTPEGCDSVVITTVSLLASDTTAVFGTSCNPADVGTTQQVLVNQNGCDSLVVTTVSLLASDTTAVFGTSCNPADVGTTQQLFANQNGCDSLVISTIAYSASDTTQLFGTSCNPADVGTTQQLFTNQSGCDSLVINTISYSASDTTQLFGTSCNPTDVGTTQQLFTNQNGCDSLVLTTVTLLASDTVLLFGTSCNPASVGTFVQNLVNASGCDSTVISTISYSLSDTTLLTAASCDPSQVGVFTQTLTTWEGCDSTVITTVSLLPSATTSLSATTCDPAMAGVFTQNLSTWQGCDSTVTTTVTLLPSATTLLAATTCDAAQAGVFIQNLNTWQGCDSIVTTTVTLLPSANTTLTATTCDAAQAGVFTQNLLTWQGCDSTVTTTVTLLPNAATSLASTTCDAVQAGIFTQNLMTWQGCDSTVTTTVTLLPNANTLISATTCDASQAGVFTQNLNTWQGCDSTVTTTVTWSPPPSLSLSTSDFNGFGVSCEGSTDGWAQVSANGFPPFDYSWQNGSNAPLLENLAPGSYSVTATDGHGCTSTAAVDLAGPPPLLLSLSVNGLDCFEGSSGGVFATGSGGAQPYAYLLRPVGTTGGSPQPTGSFGGLGAGAYELIVSDANGCLATELVAVNAPVPPTVELGEDLFLDLGDGTTLEAVASVPWDSLAQVQWSGGGDPECPTCPQWQVLPLVTTAYSITVVDGQGCLSSDGLTVYVDRTKAVYVPNAFSPNGDGINDLLQIFAKRGQVREVKSFLVFDRWGESVCRYYDFQPNDPAKGWDGTHRGQLLNAGVFVWFAEVEFVDGEVVVFKGDVVLVR